MWNYYNDCVFLAVGSSDAREILAFCPLPTRTAPTERLFPSTKKQRTIGGLTASPAVMIAIAGLVTMFVFTQGHGILSESTLVVPGTDRARLPSALMWLRSVRMAESHVSGKIKLTEWLWCHRSRVGPLWMCVCVVFREARAICDFTPFCTFPFHLSFFLLFLSFQFFFQFPDVFSSGVVHFSSRLADFLWF